MELFDIHRPTYLNLRAKHELTEMQRFELCYKIACYYITEGNIRVKDYDISKALDILKECVYYKSISKSLLARAESMLQYTCEKAMKTEQNVENKKRPYSILYYALSAIVEQDEESELQTHVFAANDLDVLNYALANLNQYSKLNNGLDFDHIAYVLRKSCEGYNESILAFITRAMYHTVYECLHTEGDVEGTFGNMSYLFNNIEQRGQEVTHEDIQLGSLLHEGNEEFDLANEYLNTLHELIKNGINGHLDLSSFKAFVEKYMRAYEFLKTFNHFPLMRRWIE